MNVLHLKNGELACTMPITRTDVLDLSLSVMNGKIITWFCKLMMTSSSTPHIKLVASVSLTNQLCKTMLLYHLLEQPWCTLVFLCLNKSRMRLHKDAKASEYYKNNDFVSLAAHSCPGEIACGKR